MTDERKKQVRAWFDKADHDLEAGRLTNASLPDIACFHAQQCVEKYLKGFLLAHGEEIEKTHDLIKLLEDCTHIDATFEKWRDACFELTVYGVEVRYPGNPAQPSEPDAHEAVESAAQVRDFVRSKIDV